MDKIAQTARVFKALSDPTRLRIFQFLRTRCCPVAVDDSGAVSPAVGPTVGQVCCHVTGVEKADSRISFHLKELRNAGLITVHKRGKFLLCGVDPSGLALLVEFGNADPVSVEAQC